MARHKRTSLALLLLGAMAFGAMAGSGCAISRGDRSTVRPLALDKQQFKGDWYFQKTVIEAPYETPGFIFKGATGEGYKIRWEITENYLFAYTVQPNVRNADSTVAPIMAWPIAGHFTVRYGVNYSTGEPSNVIVEDMVDKPWYQRPHFRVVWERQAITDFTDSFWIYRMLGYSSAMKEMTTNVRPEEVKMEKDYMDIVTEDVLSPALGGVFSLWGQGLHLSSFRVRYRNSFRQVKKSTYTPKPMTDGQFEKFGFFRTTILQYNPDRGLADWSYQYLTNRHNVATQAELDSYKANNTLEDQRKPSQIVYYMSPDFPKNMEGFAYQIMDEWNVAFKRATNRSDPNDRVVVLRANDHGLPKGQRREIGDVRYKFFYWVSEPISFGLLGYGPSFADPDTGEIISSAAYVYGGAVKQVANRFLLLYDMVRGAYSDDDLRNGKDYLDIVNNLNPDGTKRQPLIVKDNQPIMAPAFQGFDLDQAHQFVASPVFKERIHKLRNLDRAQIQERLMRLDKEPSLRWAMIPEELLRSSFPNANALDLQKMPNEHVEQMLASYMNPSNFGRLSMLNKLFEEERILNKHNIYLASYVDPAMTKFVKAVEKEKISREELIVKLERYIFYGTQAHEIGHTLGLRHNFEASADEPNYFKDYNELKAKQGENVPGEDGDNRHRWFYMYSSIMDYHGERYGDVVGIGKYDHAAIMYGYGSRLEISDENLNLSRSNLATYFADIEKQIQSAKTGIYKDMFSDIRITRNEIKADADATFDASFWKGQKTVTGQDVPAMKIMDASQVLFEAKGIPAKGGEPVSILRLTVDDVSDRDELMKVHGLLGVRPPGSLPTSDGIPYILLDTLPLRRHYYRFCSDELVGQSPYCNRFDSGSNPMEIVDNMIRRYDGNYPLSNWNRGRRFWRLGGWYLGARIDQFRVVSDFFQNWIFRTINENAFQGSPEYFNQLAAIQRGLSFINRVISTPEPGRHVLNAETNGYIPSADPNKTNPLDVPVGVGRYFYSKLQQDEMGLGMYRFDRIGTMYDKYIALLTLAIRDWGLNVNRLDFFFVNFSDFFSKDDVHNIYAGAISGQFEKKYSMTYGDKTIAPNWHPLLQYFGMFIAMAELNSGLFGNTYTHYMTVGVTGNGSAWTPPQGADTVQFTNAAGTRTYFAVQTNDQKSIAYKLVSRGRELAEKIKVLRAAQPTSAVIQAELQEKEAELRQLETVVIMMKRYVQVFYE
ncbi:zinc-dependent metalloprotease [Myxococcota bacterium]|nr:zinc-dependent metalloprotease [Myxococcota bacterium]